MKYELFFWSQLYNIYFTFLRRTLVLTNITKRLQLQIHNYVKNL
jgi:hypothetical protein